LFEIKSLKSFPPAKLKKRKKAEKVLKTRPNEVLEAITEAFESRSTSLIEPRELLITEAKKSLTRPRETPLEDFLEEYCCASASLRRFALNFLILYFDEDFLLGEE
jgi:hypothetical protein